MSDSSDHPKYKWTPESTTLLVSVWTDKQVQKQLEYATKPQLVWESIARYMRKKGYNVTGKQCRSRMKQVLVCYREAKRAGTRGSVEQYYESIERVLISKKSEHQNFEGIDTVDSTTNVKSPPKDVKTNKNLQMRYKYREPANCLYRSEALSPTWIVEKDEDYPDSPESNETVLAQPFRTYSTMRDVATNTRRTLDEYGGKLKQNTLLVNESPIKETIRPNQIQRNCFSEVPLQNAVQNVQNQIIHENMQQHMQQNQVFLQQNLLQNQLLEQNMLNPCRNHMLYVNNEAMLKNQAHVMHSHNHHQGNTLCMQNQCQHCQQMTTTNQAMPQEPRKNNFGQNIGQNCRQYPETLSPDSSSDTSPNMNDAFCQSSTSEPAHNLNETYDQPTENNMNLPNINTTTLTNNATFNDDTLSIEFMQESSSPSDNEHPKSKDFAVNTDTIPNAPFRKKKAQKLEQLMLNAINSQNEVVNKILSAQNEMVNKFLDVDRDRQNRLENRLDNLLEVVRVSVLNKNSEKESESPPKEPLITNLLPPPMPGMMPPKLDLVPPKPCRVPCTVTNVQLINQNPTMTKPGVVSPSRKPGAIWSKLGPVSMSPFVRAQQQLGLIPTFNAETRTQSSAERRIARELAGGMDIKTLIMETETFIEMEKRLVEKDENAKMQLKNDRYDLTARRKLFLQAEPTVAMILTTAFLDAERQSQEIFENARINFERNKLSQMRREMLNMNGPGKDKDEVLGGQGESYDRLQQLKMQKFLEKPCISSTPAKFGNPQNEQRVPVDEHTNGPQQSIQQLAQLVMNSARWRNAAVNSRPTAPNDENASQDPVKAFDAKMNTLNWIQDRYSYGSGQQATAHTALPLPKGRYSYNEPVPGVEPLGFVLDKLNVGDTEERPERDYGKKIGFVNEKTLPFKKKKEDNHPIDQLRQLYEQHLQQQAQKNGNVISAQQSEMIRQYIQDMLDRKIVKESDSDNDEEFLDTTATMHAPSRRSSFNSGTSTKSSRPTCVIS